MRKSNIIIIISLFLFFSCFPISFNMIKKKIGKENFVLKKENNHFISKKPFLDVKQVFNDKNKIKHNLVVFVHGTILPYPSVSTLIKTLKGDKGSPLKKKSFHYKYLNNIRYKGIYKYQPINDVGLIPINFVDNADNNDNSIQKKSRFSIASYYDYYIKRHSSVQNYYYTFGWSGHLNQGRRHYWAEVLYKNLIKEINKIKKTGKTKIGVTILAHSHGGNISLKLADIEKKYKKNLKINNLVLLGTPVQKETSDLIYSDIFNRIYNIYSRGDPVQVMDFVSTRDLFSKRKFRGINTSLPSRLVQLEVSCGKLKPMHNELWFLRGKWNLLYRRRLSIYPYPVSIFSPEVLYVLNKIFPKSTNMRLDMEKYKGRIKLSFTDLDKKGFTYKYIINLPQL